MDIGRGNEASKSDESGTSKHSLRQPELVIGNRNTTHPSERSTGTGDHSTKHIELGVETGRSKPSEVYPGGGIESNLFFLNSDAVVSDELLRPSSSSSSYSSSSSSSMDDHVSGSLVHDPILTQSPPVQVMDRIGVYDPYRISSSVFARSKSITPADWSVTSNDSLFSIQVEDNSLSRDHALSLKSITSPVPSAMDPDNMSVEIDKSEADLISDDTLKDETRSSYEELIGEKATPPTRFWNSPTRSDYSDDTRTSVHSFAFPVRKMHCLHATILIVAGSSATAGTP